MTIIEDQVGQTPVGFGATLLYEMTRMDAEELGSQLMAPPGVDGSSLNIDAAASLQREDQERRQSLWRWLLLAALALFITETALSNWVSRTASGAQAAISG